mmetsp:Transcript_88101/g.247727  ORF Transcript_88101/g.247727 Transcript_88101/m.247727 type:complete len:531 (-) Transcript_88101:74-1666(-)
MAASSRVWGMRVLVAAAWFSALQAFVQPGAVFAGQRPSVDAHRQRPPERWSLPRKRRSTSLRAASFEDAFTLPPDDVVEAVSRTGTRMTASDVAAAGGMSLEKARKGLVALAAAIGSEANLEVSKSGELIYVMPPDPRAALSKASTAASLRENWKNIKPVLFTALRIAFGVALFASIAVIYSALIVLSSSGSSDREDRDRRGSDSFGGGSSFGGDASFGGGGFGGGGFGFGPSLWYGPSPFDLFFYRPYYTYGGYEYGDVGEDRKPKMGFLEAVYSFVFGDGDPNEGREQKALAAVASTARRNGGVVTAEQLAPLLDPPEYKRPGESRNVDESWVLKALTRLNGRPEVTSSGEIVYVFDDLQTTAGDVTKGEKAPSILKEQRVPFSLADEGQLFFAGLLGAFNLVGAGYLGLKLAEIPAGLLLPGWLGAVQFAYPALLAYAVGFLVAPVVRNLSLASENEKVDDRNRKRTQWRDVLQSGQVDGKLAEARKFRTAMRQVGAGDSVYSTAVDASSQGAASDLADFDRKLGAS